MKNEINLFLREVKKAYRSSPPRNHDRFARIRIGRLCDLIREPLKKRLRAAVLKSQIKVHPNVIKVMVHEDLPFLLHSINERLVAMQKLAVAHDKHDIPFFDPWDMIKDVWFQSGSVSEFKTNSAVLKQEADEFKAELASLPSRLDAYVRSRTSLLNEAIAALEEGIAPDST
jgi:hypothetical protein